MKINIRLLLAISLSVILLLCEGCASVIGCDADEIKLSSWRCSDNENMTAELSFSDNEAVFTIKSKSSGEEIAVSGLCVFDEDSFIILDNVDKYSFGYRLSGKTLTLSYSGNELDFYKIDE